jgi:hypothetical protein
MKKKADEPMTTKVFAEEMGINYRTALNWLNAGLVPGAVEHDSPIGKYWMIPRTALEMEKPKPGPKKGTKRASKRAGMKNALKKMGKATR